MIKMIESDQESVPDAAMEAVALLARAARLTVVFRRLFWVAMSGLALTIAVTVFGGWDAHPIWCLGLAGLGQAWMAGVALWAFQVYAHVEKLELRAAEMALARGAVPHVER